MVGLVATTILGKEDLEMVTEPWTPSLKKSTVDQGTGVTN